MHVPRHIWEWFHRFCRVVGWRAGGLSSLLLSGMLGFAVLVGWRAGGLSRLLLSGVLGFVMLVGSVSCAFQPLDDADGDGFSDRLDCAPADAARHPGATERCDGQDDDCDGVIDAPPPEDAPTFYLDADGDGEGSVRFTVQACAAPPGYVASAADCDDGQASISPSAAELCDGKDNTCDGEIDEGLDQDGDGLPPCALDDLPGDCDDADPSVYGGALERCDGKDNDCNGVSDDVRDGDADGFTTCPLTGEADCDDARDAVYPGALEVCDRLDNDCDGIFDEGFDQDFDGFTSCGITEDTADCDDTSAERYPGADEQCDGRDQDCDGLIDEGFSDADQDGAATCIDCDDEDSSFSPLAYEQCNGRDDDCDGLVDNGSDCPCEVAYFDDNAYMFCLFTTDWTTARGDCEDYGYALVTVGSKAENDWIQYTASALLVTDWWIGFNDVKTEGTFEWVSGESVGYTRWASGEPNNLSNEDCVLLYADGSWNDKACSSPWYRSICENVSL